MTKIYITGCAKSGTTMLLDMFHAFKKTWVIVDEVTLEDFTQLTSERVGNFDFVIGKRSVGTIFSASNLTQRDINRQLYLIAQHGIKVVNIVRDGRNVVKSYLESWGYYNPFEWMECVIQANTYSNFIHHSIRFEDLVTTPDAVQLKLSSAFGFQSVANFSDYPKFISNANRSPSSKSYNLRPIDKSKTDIDKTSYLRRPNDVDFFNGLLDGLGYEILAAFGTQTEDNENLGENEE